jgi:hypothetical protein
VRPGLGVADDVAGLYGRHGRGVGSRNPERTVWVVDSTVWTIIAQNTGRRPL